MLKLKQILGKIIYCILKKVIEYCNKVNILSYYIPLIRTGVQETGLDIEQLKVLLNLVRESFT